MKYLIIILLIFLIGCTQPKKELSFEGKTFEWINVHDFNGNDMIEYAYMIFLENNRFLNECRLSNEDIFVLHQGNWNYYTENEKEYLVLEQWGKLIDTLLIVRNDNFQYFEFYNQDGGINEYKQVYEDCSFDTNLIANKTWKCINDSIMCGFDSIDGNPIFFYPEFEFHDNHRYCFTYRNINNYNSSDSGNWEFKNCGNRILLDSLVDDRNIIKLQKVEKDILIFYKRDKNSDPRKIICENKYTW